MELNSNSSPTSDAAVDVDNVNTNGVSTNELTRPAPNSPLHSHELNNGVDLGNEQGSELDESSDSENSSRSKDENQSSESEFAVIEPDVEIVIKNQQKYYLYCPCCGEDITKTVKIVKKSDPKPIKITENKDQGKIEIDSNSSGSSKKEKERLSFPRWFIDVFAWLLLCSVIVFSIFFTSPMKLQLIFQEHLQLVAIPSLLIPSASATVLLPMFAVLFVAIRFGYSLRFKEERGDKRVDSESSNDTISQEESHKVQAEDPDLDYDKKKDNQKVHPNPVDSLPKEQEVNNETHEAKAEAEETVLQPNVSTDSEPCKGSSNKLEVLKSIVYGGLTESITSLCTVTSAAASGASIRYYVIALVMRITSLTNPTISENRIGRKTTRKSQKTTFQNLLLRLSKLVPTLISSFAVNVLALGVANLSSGLLLIVHNLQELINEKSKRGENTKEEEDRYEQVLGRKEKFRFHSVVVISSFIIFGVIPPLVYGFSFRTKIEKRQQEYKILAVYGASLVCVALLSIGKAYVEKRGEYLKTLFRYTTMATTASGFSQFVGYFVSKSLEKYGFYDEGSSQTPTL